MNWSLFLGDCLGRDGIPSFEPGHVDVTITDPPYSEYVIKNSRRGNGHRAGGSVKNLDYAGISAETVRAVSAEIGRVTRRWALVFCDVESVSLWRSSLEAGGMDYVRTGAWIKECATPQFSGDRPAIGFEAIVIAHAKGRKRWNGRGSHGVWSHKTAYRAGDKIVHTSQKPIGLMRKLVQLFSNPGETVLDPFSGGGTTGVAALEEGRDFTGWEADQGFYLRAYERLSNCAQRLREEPRKAVTA